jgi:hypothetical protein
VWCTHYFGDLTDAHAKDSRVDEQQRETFYEGAGHRHGAADD